MKLLEVKLFHSVKVDRELNYIDTRITPQYTLELDGNTIIIRLVGDKPITKRCNINNAIYWQTEQDV